MSPARAVHAIRPLVTTVVGSTATLLLVLAGLIAPAQAEGFTLGDPVLDLRFEGDVADASPLAHPTQLKGHLGGAPSVQYVDGVLPGTQAVKLGGNTWIDLGSSTALQPSSLTLSFWIRPDAAMSGEEVITWNKQAYNSDGWYLSSESNTSPLALSVGPATGQPYKVRVASSDRANFFPAGQWTHVAVAFDGQSKEVAFYRNGVRTPSTVASPVGGSATGGITASEALPKTIGFNGPQYNGAYLKSALDQYRLYDEVATPADVVELYEQGGTPLDRTAVATSDADDLTLPGTASVALVLPEQGQRGSTITWASDQPDVIGVDGSVHPPEPGSDDAAVTLTATVRFLDGEPVTREFEVTVPAPREVLGDTGLDVLLSDDYLDNAAAKEREYLLGLDSEKFLFWFYWTAGLTPPTETGYGGWENGNVSGNFRGHAFGHYMSALAMSYASTTDAEDKAALHAEIVEAVEGLAEVQASYAGTARAGYIGPFRDTALDAVEGRGASDDSVIVPYYNLHKVLAGLLEIDKYVDDATGDQALAIARGFGEYLYGRVSTLADTSVMLRTEYGGMNDALYELYARSDGNPHFKEAAEAFDEVTLFRQLASGQDVLAGKHANTTIPKLIGALKRYTVFTQDPELYATLTEQEKSDLPMYLTAAQNFWQIVIDDHTYATGANSQSEHFHDPDSLHHFATRMGGTGNPQTAETCNEYNMLKLSRELFKLSQEVKYADYYENTFINTIVSSQNPDTGMTTYFQAMAPGYNKLYALPFTDFWCCVGTGMENFSKLGDSIYFTGSDGVWVNMFWSSTVRHEETNLELTQVADLPNDDTVRFTVDSLDGGALAEGTTVRLRVPDWIAGQPGLEVNGSPVAPVVKRGYVVLGGLAAGDVVDYTLPMEVRVVETPDNPDFLALKYGPVLLSAGLGTRDLDRFSPVGIGVRVPVVDPAAQHTVLVETPTVAAWKDAVAENVVRVEDTADGQVQFALRNTADGGDLRFTPHHRRHDERYALYLTYETQDSDAAQQRILDAKRQQRAAEFEIDQLTTFDNNNFENAKNVKFQNSSVGTFNGLQFRHANGPAGWFSWDLEVDPAAERNFLKVRYYTGDNGRTFDVYLNDELLKTERVNNAAGSGVFYLQTDEIPRKYLDDPRWKVDQSGDLVLDENGDPIPVVTVRFQSTGGFAGGVFGIFTTRPEVHDTNPELSALSASPGTLAPAFAPDHAAYRLEVPPGTGQVSLDLDPHVPSGLVEVDGVLVDDTRPRRVELLEDGPTTVHIESFAQDHVTSTTYTVVVEEADPFPALEATEPPTVTGTAMVGRRLRAGTGTWNVEGVTLAYRWLADGTPIAGATSATYTIRGADVGRRLQVRVTATRTGHETGTALSAPTARVAKAVTQVRVSPSRTTVDRGDHVRLAIRVSATGVVPTGSVRIYDGTRLLKRVALDDGAATTRIRVVGEGRHRIVVRYPGSTWAAPSSASTTLTAS